MDFLLLQLGVFVLIYLVAILFKSATRYLKKTKQERYLLLKDGVYQKSTRWASFFVGFGYGGAIATMFQSSLLLAICIASVGAVSNFFCASCE